jgi:hypothetical protein
MSETVDDDQITIDDVEYDLENLSNPAKAQVANIRFVDAQLLQLENEWAVADTARMGYANALKAELEHIEVGK